MLRHVHLGDHTGAMGDRRHVTAVTDSAVWYTVEGQPGERWVTHEQWSAWKTGRQEPGGERGE